MENPAEGALIRDVTPGGTSKIGPGSRKEGGMGGTPPSPIPPHWPEGGFENPAEGAWVLEYVSGDPPGGDFQIWIGQPVEGVGWWNPARTARDPLPGGKGGD
jgi:hypothetical protein